MALLIVAACCVGCAPAVAVRRDVPMYAVDNPHPNVDSVTLVRQRCTGRNAIDDPRCEAYSVTILADGRVLWDPWQFVAQDEPTPSSIDRAQARRTIDRARARVDALQGWQCGIDHAHYVEIIAGQAGRSTAVVARGCGSRFQRAASPIDRAAQTHRLRQ